jgi:hypothetical protein
MVNLPAELHKRAAAPRLAWIAHTSQRVRRCRLEYEERAMAEGFVHTVSRDGRWNNTIEGGDQAIAVSHETKAAVVAAGRAEAMRRKTEHVIHRQDGTSEERNSYGNDPTDRQG